MVAVIAPYVANQTGWVAAEVGRQPWVVYGLLRTEDAVSPSVPGEHILTSIVLFSLIYLALGALWLVVMNHKIQHGPEDAQAASLDNYHWLDIKETFPVEVYQALTSGDRVCFYSYPNGNCIHALSAGHWCALSPN